MEWANTITHVRIVEQISIPVRNVIVTRKRHLVVTKIKHPKITDEDHVTIIKVCEGGDSKMNYGLCSSFVCLSDVSGVMEEMNTVIHNPNIDIELDKRILTRCIHERFKVQLNSFDLNRLVSYDKEHLNEFVRDIRRLIWIHQNVSN